MADPARMRLYAGSSSSFIEDTTQNRIEGILTAEFQRNFGRRPSDPERHSWSNSLVRAKDALVAARLRDNGVILEYELLPSSRRLDCMITGRNASGQPHAEVIELKQWEQCDEAAEPNEVLTFVGQGRRLVLHPSVQVGGYEQFLRDMNTAFYGEDPVSLGSCAYLHNFKRAEARHLTDPKFESAIAAHPLFLSEDFELLVKHLRGRLALGGGLPILLRVEHAPLRPSMKLMVHVADMIQGRHIYQLLDEQRVVFDTVVGAARRWETPKDKAALIVRGGPGTGKSVIALNLMATLLREGRNARYATGSKAFTETLKKVLGSRAAVQFDWTMSYAQAAPNSVDVVIVDEAHRIRLNSNARFIPKSRRSGIPQVQEILKAARVAVFFVDDLQGVRPSDVGTSDYIRSNAEAMGIPARDFTLDIQFRCKGSDGFIQWVDSVLGLTPGEVHFLPKTDAFEFRVLDSAAEVEALVRKRSTGPTTARLAAGFCWPWSSPLADGSLVNDVVIGDFRMPWNAKPGAGRLAPGIPVASLWGTEPGGIDQVGCVYTAQGFEFDYVGVIVGPDLQPKRDGSGLEGLSAESQDPAIPSKQSEEASVLIRRAYRVLLSRGIEGCFVHFVNPATRAYFQSRMSPPTQQDA
jgi:uncharacterized protein